MGLRCLLGHDFGPAEVERERQEEGNEMVVTIREVETCTRCGEQQIVSENKEITSIRSAADVGLDGPSTADASGAPDAGETGTVDVTADAGESAEASRTAPPTESPTTGDATDDETDDAAVFIDGDGAEVSSMDEATGGSTGAASEGADSGEGGTSAEAGETLDAPETAEADDAAVTGDADDADATGGTDEAPSADVDDGVILDAEDDQGPDEWEDADAELERPSTDVDVDAELAKSEVDAEETDAEIIDAAEPEDDPSTADAPRDADDGPVPWPEHDDVSTDEPGGEPTPWPEAEGEDEGFDAEPSDGSSVDVSFGGGITPQRNGSAEGEPSASEARTEYVEAPSQSKPSGKGFVHPSNQSDRRSTNTSPTEYYCANCEAVWPVGRSSMRPGDICPECHKGYVGERDR